MTAGSWLVNPFFGPKFGLIGLNERAIPAFQRLGQHTVANAWTFRSSCATLAAC